VLQRNKIWRKVNSKGFQWCIDTLKAFAESTYVPDDLKSKRGKARMTYLAFPLFLVLVNDVYQ